MRLDAIDTLPANLGGTEFAMPGQPSAAELPQVTSQIDQLLMQQPQPVQPLQPAPAPAASASSLLPDDIMSLVPDSPSQGQPVGLQAGDRVAAPGAQTLAAIDMSDAYYVVLSANRVPANAERDARRFDLPGVEVKTFTVGGKPMHMVVVGPLPEPEARVVQGEALGLGVLDAWLKKG